jgi:hypothetical protein
MRGSHGPFTAFFRFVLIYFPFYSKLIASALYIRSRPLYRVCNWGCVHTYLIALRITYVASDVTYLSLHIRQLNPLDVKKPHLKSWSGSRVLSSAMSLWAKPKYCHITPVSKSSHRWEYLWNLEQRPKLNSYSVAHRIFDESPLSNTEYCGLEQFQRFLSEIRCPQICWFIFGASGISKSSYVSVKYWGWFHRICRKIIRPSLGSKRCN